MNKNLFNEYVEITKELDRSLKKCFINHLVIYNYSLHILYDNPECNFKDMMRIVNAYITEKNIEPVITIALMNEIYYQFKKFKRNIRVKKLITDIQYFTFLSMGYHCKGLEINEDRTKIKIENMEGEIILPYSLPEIEEKQSVYINLSYSNIENKYKLSVYTG